MTYNIEMKRDDDGWADRDLDKVVETITTAAPDVVGLQEDTDDWYAESTNWGLSKTNHLAGLETAGYTSTNFSNSKYERLNIFYKSDKLRLIKSGRETFEELIEGEYSYIEGPDGVDMSRDRQGRMFSYAIFEFLDEEDNGTGETVLVVNTHLHWRRSSSEEGSSKENALVRQYESRVLRAWLDDMAQAYPTQVVMGDMNDTPGDPPLDEFTDGNGGFEDARVEALNKVDTGGTLASTSTYADRDTYVFDHILYRNMTAVKYSVIDNKVDANDTRYPSDHLPVISKFVCYAE